MTQEQETPTHPLPKISGPDWRIWLGLIITIVWLLVLSLYVGNTIGWLNIASAPIAMVGNFLEGAFAPLAFLWLVIGYFLQKKELTHNTEAIRMQHTEIQKSAEQAAIQSQSLKASVFLQIAESVKQQLGAIAAFLFVSSQGASTGGVVSEDRIGELWGNLNNTDPEGFSRSLLQLRFIHGQRYAYKLLYGTELRTHHCESFIFNFERLLASAGESDEQGIIRDALLGSAHGRLYQWMIDYRDDPPASFRYEVYDFDPDSID